MKNRIIAITGVTGVGKDYLAALITEKYGIGAVNMGTLIAEELAVDRDVMMRVTPPGKLYEAQLAAYHKAAVRQPGLVTCHAVRPGKNGLAYAWELERILNPLTYIFVTAPPEVIFKRVRQRNKNNERKCREVPVEQIRREQEAKLGIMKELSSRLGCSLLVINNTTNSDTRTMRQVDGVIGAIL